MPLVKSVFFRRSFVASRLHRRPQDLCTPAMLRSALHHSPSLEPRFTCTGDRKQEVQRRTWLKDGSAADAEFPDLPGGSCVRCSTTTPKTSCMQAEGAREFRVLLLLLAGAWLAGPRPRGPPSRLSRAGRNTSMLGAQFNRFNVLRITDRQESLCVKWQHLQGSSCTRGPQASTELKT